MNRDYGKRNGTQVTYAPDVLVTETATIFRPTAAQYLAANYKHIVDISPETDEKHYAVAVDWTEDETTLTRVYEEREIPTVARKFSKLQLIIKLKAEGLYAAFKAAISAADLADEWQAAQVLDESYPQFSVYRTQMCTALGIDENKCEEILAASVEV